MSAFRLKPYEDVIGGVRYRGGVLRLRPSVGAEALDVYGIGIGAILAVAAVATRNIVLGLLVVPTVLVSCRFLICRVTAAQHKIKVVNKWHRRSLDVDDVAEARVESFRPGRGFLPFAGPTTIWPRSFSAGVIVLRDGQKLRVDALVGLPRSDGDEIATPVEAKVSILQRWIASERRLM